MVATLLVLIFLGVAATLHVAYPGGLVALLPSANMRLIHLDFDTFRLSAVALLRGDDIYTTDALLTNLNPPLLTVLFTPFALLDGLLAYRVFAGVSLLLVVGVVLTVARELGLRARTTAAVTVAVLAGSPLHGMLVLGQIYAVLLVGLVAGWLAQRRGRPSLAAALWGVTVALKPSLAPVLLLALVLRRWPALWTGLSTAAMATAAGVLVAGPSSAAAWLQIALNVPVPAVPDNASLPGLAARLGLPVLVGVVLGGAVLVGTLVWLARHRGSVDATGAAPWALIAAGLLFAPVAWHNYLLLLVPGVLVLLADGRRAVAAVLLAAPTVPVAWNFLWDGVSGGAVALSLYCAILLGYWWALLSSCCRRPTATTAPAGGTPARSRTRRGRPSSPDTWTPATAPRSSPGSASSNPATRSWSTARTVPP